MAIKLKLTGVNGKCNVGDIPNGVIPKEAKTNKAMEDLNKLRNQAQEKAKTSDMSNMANWSDGMNQQYLETRAKIQQDDVLAIEDGKDTFLNSIHKLALDMIEKQGVKHDEWVAGGSNPDAKVSVVPKAGPFLDHVKGMIPDAKGLNAHVKARLAVDYANELIDSERSHITVDQNHNIMISPKYEGVEYPQETIMDHVYDLLDGYDVKKEELPLFLPERDPKVHFTFTSVYMPNGDPVAPPVAGPDFNAVAKYNAHQALRNAIDGVDARQYAEAQQKKVKEKMLMEETIYKELMTEQEYKVWEEGRKNERNYESKIKIARDDYINNVERYFDVMKRDKTFYLKTKHDSRGRFYYKGNYLKPQGVDFELAGIMFTNAPKEVTPKQMDWFKVHIANIAGKDKGEHALFPARIKWYNENIKDDPNNYDLIEDKPISGFVQLNELVDGNVGNIPVAFDATTSAYQFVAYLMGDMDGLGTKTNIGNTPNIKNDMYTYLVNRVKEKTGIMDDPHIKRGVFKHPSMMYVYGSGDTGIKNHIEKEYLISIIEERTGGDMTPEKIRDAVAGLTDQDKKRAKELGNAFMSIIKTDPEMSNAKNFRDLLQKSALGNKSGVYAWEFPNKQWITHYAFDKRAYQTQRTSIAKGTLLDATIPKRLDKTKGASRIKYPNSERVNKWGKYVQTSIPANFVQSVDAYVMNYVGARMLAQGKPFLGTHDSISTTVHYVEEVQALYIEAMQTLGQRRPEWQGRNFMEQAIHTISGGKQEIQLPDYDTKGTMSLNEYHLS